MPLLSSHLRPMLRMARPVMLLLALLLVGPPVVDGMRRKAHRARVKAGTAAEAHRAAKVAAQVVADEKAETADLHGSGELNKTVKEVSESKGACTFTYDPPVSCGLLTTEQECEDCESK